MRGRRTRVKKHTNNFSFNFSLLNLTKLILEILIVIFMIIFIFSSIKYKKYHSNVVRENLIANNNLENTVSDNMNEVDNTSSDDKSQENTQDTNATEANLNKESQKNSINKSSSTTINMAFTGDIMCHDSIYKDAYNSEQDIYDFSYIFENIKYNIQTADIAVRKFRNYFFWKIDRI